jgi:competence protein ComEA
MRKLVCVLGIALGIALAGFGLDTPAQAGDKAVSADAAQVQVNVNTAGVAELTQLPGIGEKTAQAIVDFREQKGDFQKVEDLLEVKGIGEKKLAAIQGSVVLK